jgi:8-oxo-dGTP pyrophosphatase MutT (NUDIX family)
VAIVEVLTGSPEFERRVAAGEPTERVAEAARADGMRTLWQSGLAHVAAGRTTVDEVARVATPDEAAPPEQRVDGSRAVTRIAAPSLGTFELRDDLDVLVERSRSGHRSFRAMTAIEVGTVDVFVIRPLAEGWRVLALRRTVGTRCPGAWEPVHGHIEPGEEPEDAALREVREETGLAVDRLYVVRVQPFYLRKVKRVEMAAVFAAFVAEPADVTIAGEHDDHAWLSVDDALARYGFPGERASLREIVELLATGDAGAVDDVMRVT